MWTPLLAFLAFVFLVLALTKAVPVRLRYLSCFAMVTSMAVMGAAVERY